MTTAHYLTLSRILFTPLMVLLYLRSGWLGLPPRFVGPLLLTIFLISELSDAFDGYFARKFDEVTDLGKLLDPLADSLSRLALFFMFTQGVVAIPMEWPLIIFAREFVVSTLRTICALRGFALSARTSGKLKAVLQSGTVFVILIGLTLTQLNALDVTVLQMTATSLVACNAFFSLLSGVDYFAANWSYVRRLL